MSWRRVTAFSTKTILALAAAALAVPEARAATTELISRNARGAVGSDMSHTATISNDGRRVAFISEAVNLVQPDTNGHLDDVFVFDRATRKTTIASVSSQGVQGNDICWTARISGDGQSVAFVSRSTNLVPGDASAWDYVFVRDLVHGATVRASIDRDGQPMAAELGAISTTGRFVVFTGYAAGKSPNVYLRDLKAGITRLVGVGLGGRTADGWSSAVSVSANGRYVLFDSSATNLVSGDTNRRGDVFVRDMFARKTIFVSVGLDGAVVDSGSSGAGISENGRYVAFSSAADNIVPTTVDGPQLYVRDLDTATTSLASIGSDGQPVSSVAFAAISGDGRTVAFDTVAAGVVAGDTNGVLDVFVRDLQPGVTERISVSASGAQAGATSMFYYNGVLSRDGGVVAFTSAATNLVPADPNPRQDVYVRVR